MKYSQLFVGIVIGIVLLGTIGGAYYFGTKSGKPVEVGNTSVTLAPTYTVEARPSTTITNTPTQSVATKGTIEGSLAFPSQGIPKDMKVCAQNWISNEVICTSTHIEDPKYTYGVGYKLEVPTGEYYVYAEVSTFENYKAYYNKYVTCGLKYECTDTTPIIVKISAGETASKIDPQDWYHYEPKM